MASKRLRSVTWKRTAPCAVATGPPIAPDCAASASLASRSWRDGYGLLSLAATVLSYMSKESAAIGAPLMRTGAVRMGVW